MSISGIQGQLLEVTVVGCNKLKNTEFISKQDPYVCVEYAGTKFRTRTCTDGGKNPTFQEKFSVTLIEGLREISISVWNSNTITSDDFIGNGKIQLQKVLSQGYDDCPWTLQDKRGKYSGEIRLIMHYANAKANANANANANKPAKNPAPSAPPAPQYAGTPHPQVPLFSGPPTAAPYPPTNYPPPAAPQPLYPSYAPNAGHPPPPYHQPAAYHPQYPPTSSYPPQTAYPPPPPQVDPYRYPPGPYAPHSYPPPY